jgi:endonuclease YncB( thermonuclease family)
MKRPAVLVLLFAALLFSIQFLPAAAQTTESATLIQVIDGDTIDVQLASGEVARVRYIGIDTPETGESCYREATLTNAALLRDGPLTLVKDTSETDRYGRLLRYVYAGETFVNAELVARGFAVAVEYPPDLENADLFAALEQDAASAGLGCLNGNAANGPAQIYYVAGNNINVRACERTTCDRVTTLPYGSAVSVLAEVDGESVSGSPTWYRVRLADESVAFIHSSLLTDRQPATPRPVVSGGASGGGGSSAPSGGSSGGSAPASTPVPAPVSTPVPAGPGYACNCQKTCGQMTCDEAYFQLNQCGCSRRDGDRDGVPCEDICPGG